MLRSVLLHRPPSRADSPTARSQGVKQEQGIPDAPVVAFGGSYGAACAVPAVLLHVLRKPSSLPAALIPPFAGGDLATWLRLRYPETVAAAVASSAPLRCNLVDGQGWDATTFWQVVTDTASPANGAAPACVPNARAAFAALFSLADSDSGGGSGTVEEALGLCLGVLGSEGVEGVEGSTVDATIVATWLRGAFDVAAMGSYPTSSSYFTGAVSCCGVRLL